MERYFDMYFVLLISFMATASGHQCYNGKFIENRIMLKLGCRCFFGLPVYIHADNWHTKLVRSHKLSSVIGFLLIPGITSYEEEEENR